MTVAKWKFGAAPVTIIVGSPGAGVAQNATLDLPADAPLIAREGGSAAGVDSGLISVVRLQWDAGAPPIIAPVEEVIVAEAPVPGPGNVSQVDENTIRLGDAMTTDMLFIVTYVAGRQT